MSDTTPPVPEGWYSDPEDETLQRWWDGRAWASYTRLSPSFLADQAAKLSANPTVAQATRPARPNAKADELFSALEATSSRKSAAAPVPPADAEPALKPDQPIGPGGMTVDQMLAALAATTGSTRTKSKPRRKETTIIVIAGALLVMMALGLVLINRSLSSAVEKKSSTTTTTVPGAPGGPTTVPFGPDTPTPTAPPFNPPT